MLRIGPTIYNHTPYARVHSGFLPLFERLIRLHRCLIFRKVTVFLDFSRLRIALSSDTSMADEKDASGGSAAHEFGVQNRHCDKV
jgi:hypothetical protein